MGATDGELGDRMKVYESMANPRLLPRVPILARLDGRTFHTFTKHAARPFSATFHGFMVEVTRALVLESQATVGYTQSDEITLAWIENPFFDGNVQKMCSTLAALASTHLGTMRRDPKDGLAWGRGPPTFDCRVWAVPNLAEAANVFLWRQQDASRNSVQMAARFYFSHKECDGKDTKELQEMLFQKHMVNWNSYPAAFKRGTFVVRATEKRELTPAQLAELPELHEAKKNPAWQTEGFSFERAVLAACDVDLRTLSGAMRIGALFGETVEVRDRQEWQERGAP